MNNEKLMKMVGIFMNLFVREYDPHSFRDFKSTVYEEDYTLHCNVEYIPPDFVPAINHDTGELWFVCSDKDIDLKYTERDDKFVFSSDDEEIIDFLKEFEIVKGIEL